jgi:serine/threonine-protein kinase HipA
MKELIVQLAGQRAGRLIQRDNGNMQFRYDADYEGPPVSHAMPVQPEAHPHRTCLAVFGGLLLEGAGRETLARTLGISSNNDFALLEEIGRDVAGAVTLLEEDEPAPTEPAIRRIDDATLDRLLGDLPQRPLAADPKDGIRLSLAGAQPKLPVILDAAGAALPQNAAAPTTHILKPEPQAFPGLVDNEWYCMTLAAEVGLRVAEVRKERSVTGRPYLVVERYDRDLMADPIRRLHQEDFCQALGVPSPFKYQNEGGPGVRDAVALVREATAAPVVDLPRLWEALAFNWLIGNCDAHAKNFSLLYDAGTPTLAPLYDLVSTVLYPGLTTRLAMSIDGATDLGDVNARAWTALATDVGVRPDFATRTVQRIAARTALAAPRVAEAQGTDAAHAIAERVMTLAATSAGAAR